MSVQQTLKVLNKFWKINSWKKLRYTVCCLPWVNKTFCVKIKETLKKKEKSRLDKERPDSTYGIVVFKQVTSFLVN